MNHHTILRSAPTPTSSESRPRWLRYFWEGGLIWATGLGCVWVGPDEDTDWSYRPDVEWLRLTNRFDVAATATPTDVEIK